MKCMRFIGTEVNKSSIEEQQEENLSDNQTSNQNVEQPKGTTTGSKRGRPVKKMWRRHAHISMNNRKGDMSKEQAKKRKLRHTYIEKKATLNK